MTDIGLLRENGWKSVIATRDRNICLPSGLNQEGSSAADSWYTRSQVT